MTGITLGPFELRVPLGRGGMGEVWRGLHVREGTAVAVKVLTSHQASSPEFLWAFRNEVRAAARLVHPGIITVLDYGVVTATTEQESGGRILEGSPYLVMSLAREGSLLEKGPVTRWEPMKAMLLELLEALAHAHARGVIHRDLKPGNVLLDEGRVKLTDFGIAHAALYSLHSADLPVEKDSGVEAFTRGTPHYMAPEQIRGLWRDQGPWTDLYALGCLVHFLVGGRAPWSGAQSKVFKGHLYRPPPPLQPTFPLPARFHLWLEGLLAKHPRARFQRAAEAACALSSLETPTDTHALDRSPSRTTGAMQAVFRTDFGTRAVVRQKTQVGGGDTEPTLVDTAPELAESDIAAGFRETLENPGGLKPPSGWPSPTLPASWRDFRHGQAPDARHLLGAGLGLYGLRPVPLVGREAERDALWETLSGVSLTRSTRVVLLRGVAGVGKSRLARWLCETAHEVGAATILKAFHSPVNSPSDGLGRMMAAFFRCVGMRGGRRVLVQRIERIMDALELMGEDARLALNELLQPEASTGATDMSRINHLANPTERYLLIQRIIGQLARERPVIVWLDDVQWGRDAIGLAQFLVRSPRASTLPVLLVLTVRTEEMAEVQAPLDVLLAHPYVRSVQVMPLPERARASLVQGILGLEGVLASQVVARTAGNPLFAVQLVGDWIQRGVLRASAHGFELITGEDAPLPENIHQLWSERTLQVIATCAHTPGARHQALLALELGAVLGNEVDEGEWLRTCTRAQISPPEGLLDAMLTAGLIVHTEIGWAFSHQMLRESIALSAQQSGRHTAHHLACAEMVKALRDDSPAAWERVAHHLFAAEAYGASLEPLMRVARAYVKRSEFASAFVLLRQREASLEALEVPRTHPAWLDGWSLAALARCSNGELERGIEHVEAAEAIVGGTVEQCAFLAYCRGQIGLMLRDRAMGTEAFQQSMRHYRACGDETGIANSHIGLGIVYRRTGRAYESLESFEAAQRIFDRLNDAEGLGRCLNSMSATYITLGLFDDARRHLKQALGFHERVHNRTGRAECLNNLGEVARSLGQYEPAGAYYAQALQLLEEVGSQDLGIYKINLALIQIACGDFKPAEETLNTFREIYEREGRFGLVGEIYANLLPCYIHCADWEKFEACLARGRALMTESSIVSEDVAWTSEIAGRIATEAGAFGPARKVLQLALEHWQMLERKDKVSQIQQALAALPP